MPRYAYVNGRYVPHGQAAVHIEDRGFQFADGVYEVVTVENGTLVDEVGHIDRLGRSLSELDMDWPVSRHVLERLMRQLIAKNRLRNGIIYLQVTRGSAPRDFKFPKRSHPTLVMTTRVKNLHPRAVLEDGIRVVTIPDIRWKRRDIKSVSLLAQVLGTQKAAEAGAAEGWQVDEDGMVTEGCSSNAWIVTRDGILVTRPASHDILNGITRQSILRIAREAGIPFEERCFTVDEAYTAREAFVTSATRYVAPVTEIDDRVVANGKPGLLAQQLRGYYEAYAAGLRPPGPTA